MESSHLTSDTQMSTVINEMHVTLDMKRQATHFIDSELRQEMTVDGSRMSTSGLLSHEENNGKKSYSVTTDEVRQRFI